MNLEPDLAGTPFDPDYRQAFVPAYAGRFSCHPGTFDPGEPDCIDTHFGVVCRACLEDQEEA